MKKTIKIDARCLTKKCEQCKNYIYCFRYKGKENESKKKQITKLVKLFENYKK